MTQRSKALSNRTVPRRATKGYQPRGSTPPSGSPGHGFSSKPPPGSPPNKPSSVTGPGAKPGSKKALY